MWHSIVLPQTTPSPPPDPPGMSMSLHDTNAICLCLSIYYTGVHRERDREVETWRLKHGARVNNLMEQIRKDNIWSTMCVTLCMCIWVPLLLSRSWRRRREVRRCRRWRWLWTPSSKRSYSERWSRSWKTEKYKQLIWSDGALQITPCELYR